MLWERQIIAALIEDKDSEETTNPNHHTLSELRTATLCLREGQNDEFWSQKFLQIMTVCHNDMKRASSPLDLNTLRKVYTDAAILRGLLLSLLFSPMDAIATLDQAIIVAGPYGAGRLELVLDLIHDIQRPLSSNQWPNTSLDPSPGSNASFLKCTVPCLSTAPSFLDFQLTYSRKPFILRDFAASWPALTSRPWKTHSYLCSVAGPGRVVPVEVGSDYRSDDWQQKIMPWEVFLSFLEFEDHQVSENASNIYYLAQHDLTKQFPKLLEDVVIPDYLYADLGSSDLPGYHPPRNADRMLLNTWLGPKGTLSPAHIDPYFNFYVQVVGYKSVWLAPPSVSDSMHTFSQSAFDNDGPHSSSLRNTSRVDVFANVQDLQLFPTFVEKVIPLSMVGTLGPGDALFFPPGWWHSMRSESTSFSLSMWF